MGDALLNEVVGTRPRHDQVFAIPSLGGSVAGLIAFCVVAAAIRRRRNKNRVTTV